MDPGRAVPDDQPDAPRAAGPPLPHQRDRRALRAVPPGHPRHDPERRGRRRDQAGSRPITASTPRRPGSCWYPAAFEQLDSPEWQQLYVNAEHDGNVGVITISRETYNSDVDAELNRAIDWLKAERIARVIVTGDFHLATQMVGCRHERVLPRPGRCARGTPGGRHLVCDRQAAPRRVQSVRGLRGRQTLPRRFPGAAHALPLPGRRRGRGPGNAGGDAARGAGHGGLPLAVPESQPRPVAEACPTCCWVERR